MDLTPQALSKLTALKLASSIVEDCESIREVLSRMDEIHGLAPENIGHILWDNLMCQYDAVMTLCDHNDIYWQAMDKKAR